MSQPILAQECPDPTIIKGIYNTCDQWCMYCPATTRCLAYRTDPDIGLDRQNLDKSPEDRLYDGMMLYKRLSEAEGTQTPEVDAMLSGDPRHITMPPVNDPLEGAGGRYARLSSAYLASRDDLPFEMVRHAAGPTPFEVFAWYHFLIAVKISRAVTSSAAACSRR